MIKTASLQEQRPLTAFATRTKAILSRLIILVFCPLSLLLIPSCKQNNWLDWKTQNELWLAQNKADHSDIRETASGLQYRIKADPTPQDVRPNTTSSVVICDYTVHLINGYKVAGGHDTLYLPSCIPGFAEGCHLIHNNGDINLYIPYYLGYDNSQYESGNSYNASGRGTEGTSSYIPPYSTLIYDIHLCAVIGY